MPVTPESKIWDTYNSNENTKKIEAGRRKRHVAEFNFNYSQEEWIPLPCDRLQQLEQTIFLHYDFILCK